MKDTAAGQGAVRLKELQRHLRLTRDAGRVVGRREGSEARQDDCKMTDGVGEARQGDCKRTGGVGGA